MSLDSFRNRFHSRRFVSGLSSWKSRLACESEPPSVPRTRVLLKHAYLYEKGCLIDKKAL